ncbi:YveK family protein [Lacticaseibacillus salsurivasis]|uniref:YveK family protein n=1 Tax=Lacticaseibacillus salsurivasis TaxID=3081441 RepID=UPI0030C6E2B7
MQEISLSDVFRIIGRRLWLIILITVAVAGVIGLVAVPRTSPVYQVQGQIVIKPKRSLGDDTSTQNAYANQLVATSQDLIKSTEVLSSVSEKLAKESVNMSAGDLLAGLSVTNSPNSLLLGLEMDYTNENNAVAALNMVMSEFQEIAPHYLSISKVAIVKGNLPVSKTSTGRRQIKYLIAGVVLGGAIALLTVFALEYSRHVIRDSKYLEKKFGLRTIQVL